MKAIGQGGLSREQRQRYDERGLIKLEALIARDVAEAMADSLWGELARKHDIHRDDPQSWRAERPAQLGAFQKTGAFRAMATSDLRELVDGLIGHDRWAEPSSWGLPLVCFPQGAGRWEVPHQVWHFDLTPDPRRTENAARIFLLLAPLAPGGGGTLVATGSHRIAERLAARRGAHLSSQEMRKDLVRTDAWFRDLMAPPVAGEDRVARFMDAATVVDGAPLQVEELTGEPGDVFLMHPHALHGLSSNVRDAPRLALTQTVYPKSWTGA